MVYRAGQSDSIGELGFELIDHSGALGTEEIHVHSRWKGGAHWSPELGGHFFEAIYLSQIKVEFFVALNY